MLSDTLFTGASFSVCFTDVTTGEVILSHDATRNLAPASVMKLYPTSAALTLLGADYRFVTVAGIQGSWNPRRGILEGDIVICGGGDPALGSEYFSDHYGDVMGRCVAELSAHGGLRRVTGRVAAATSIYDSDPVPSGWAWDDIGNYYGAGVYDLNYHDNLFRVYITGFAEGTPAVIDSTDMLGSGINLKNYLISSGNSDQGYVFNGPYSYNGWIAGRVPVNRQIALRASLPDPPAAFLSVLNRELIRSGVKIDNTPSAERVTVDPGSFDTSLVIYSPPLSEIIKVTNHESVNMYAELLCKHLGYVKKGQGTFEAGLEVIEHLLDSAQCNPSRSAILDASGLSANNNISAAMTTGLLRFMYNGSNRDIFLASLPKAGESGTMKNYFRDEVFRGRVIAKTGSIGYVRSFAGYVTTAGGRTLAFTMISNGFTVPWRRVTDRMEDIVEEIIINY